eukprot:7414200-Karenia_brevis.AAC.1
MRTTPARLEVLLGWDKGHFSPKTQMVPLLTTPAQLEVSRAAPGARNLIQKHQINKLCSEWTF